MTDGRDNDPRDKLPDEPSYDFVPGELETEVLEGLLITFKKREIDGAVELEDIVRGALPLLANPTDAVEMLMEIAIKCEEEAGTAPLDEAPQLRQVSYLADLLVRLTAVKTLIAVGETDNEVLGLLLDESREIIDDDVEDLYSRIALRNIVEEIEA